MRELFMEERIMVYLMQLRITPNLKGYQYLKAVIKRVCEDESLKFKMSSRLFKEVAPQFNEKPTLFDRALRHATVVSYNRDGIEHFENLAKVRFSIRKPSAREMICVLAEKLKVELCYKFDC